MLALGLAVAAAVIKIKSPLRKFSWQVCVYSKFFFPRYSCSSQSAKHTKPSTVCMWFATWSLSRDMGCGSSGSYKQKVSTEKNIRF